MGTRVPADVPCSMNFRPANLLSCEMTTAVLLSSRPTGEKIMHGTLIFIQAEFAADLEKVEYYAHAESGNSGSFRSR